MTISRTVVGVDTAKRVFQLHWVDMETGEIVDMKLTRARFLEHFANRAPCLVAMEACGGTQHWARRLQELGHEVRLLPAKMVRPFVGGNKNDTHDARAIWTAAQQPGIKTVSIKSEEQQAILALHRMRQQLVKFRTAQINGLRGLLTEYGEVMPKGRAGMPDPRLEREDPTPSTQPRREPPGQLRPAHGCRVPNANRPTNPSLCRTQDPGGAVQTRGHALPEALRRTRDLPRDHRHITYLTNMRASAGRSISPSATPSAWPSPASSNRWGALAIRMTTPWPSPSLGCTRRR